jgi:large subunit ribosomal protein L13
MMKTYSAKPTDIQREWHLIDASGQTLGRLATRVARLLMGKHKPMFTPNQDTGDFVVIINAEKIKVTGDKLEKKVYYRHSGYPGGLKRVPLEKMMNDYPIRVIEHAVKGMLPHTRLGARMFKKLKVYAGEHHPHLGQVKTASVEGTK